jgi:DNA-binding XRE family transcriptional regulator
MPVVWVDFFRADDVAIPEGFVDIDEAIAELESDPAIRLGLEKSRQSIAEALAAQRAGRASIPQRGLAYLRLRRGWSQKALAEAIGTSQPHIARIEAGRGNVLLETANLLARALNATLTEVNEALGFGESKGEY